MSNSDQEWCFFNGFVCQRGVGGMVLDFLGSEIAEPWFRAPEPWVPLRAMAAGATLGELVRSRQSAQSRGRRNSV